MRKYLLIGVSSFVLGAGAMAYLNHPAHATAVSGDADAYHMLELFGDVLTSWRLSTSPRSTTRS